MATMSEAEKLASSSSSNAPMGVCSAVADVGSMTNRIYNQPHKFLDDSYDVRNGWYNPTATRSYVIPHPQETTDNFEIRKSASTYRAFLKSIVNTTVDPLFRGEFTINDNNDKYLPFVQTITNIETNFNLKLFVMSVMKYFYLHDLVYTVSEPMSSESDEIGKDLPITYTVPVDNIFKETKIVNTDLFIELNYRIDKSYYNEETMENIPYHIMCKYTQTEFVARTELYKDKDGNIVGGDCKKKDDNDWVRLTIDDKTINGFKYETLPVFTLKAKIDTTRISTPEMHDLAIACWDYFNTCSLHKELERKCTNPILTMQTNDSVNGVVIGANNALGYPADLERPEYLKLDMGAHEELRTSKSELRQDIYKLYLQGLQTDETKFTSEDSNEISENLFYNKVNSLSEYLEKYVDDLLINIVYAALDGKTSKQDISKRVFKLDIDFNFNFDTDREIGNIKWWELLAELYTASEDVVKRNRLIEELERKLEITDKTKTKTKE